jgi:DNA-directed RNA polymerase subunit E'/Rpb7
MKKPGEKRVKSTGIYMSNIITRNILISFNLIGNNIDYILTESIKRNYEKKCINEGYVKANSVRLLNYSSGILKGENIVFNVNFECLICKPIEGMRINVIVKNITKAGIKCETEHLPSPVIAFITRDHHNTNKEFSNIKVGDNIYVRVIGIRYELNDEYIAIIGELIKKNVKSQKINIH